MTRAQRPGLPVPERPAVPQPADPPPGSMVARPAATGPAPKPSKLTRGDALALVAVLSATFMAILDVFIVNVAAPDLRRDLRASDSDLQLVLGAYTLTYAVLLITGSRLGRAYGHVRLFRLGMTGFVTASVLCACAPSPGWLITARALQGISSAAVMPQVLSIVQLRFVDEARARALGYYAAVVSFASVTGQVAGGLIVTADPLGLGWRAVFLINVPIGVAALLLGRVALREAPPLPAPVADLRGLLTLTGGLVAVVFALIRGREAGWPPTLVLLGVVGIALLALFRHVETRSGTVAPLVDFAIFRLPYVRVGLVGVFLTQVSAGSLFLLLTLYLQDGLGLNALDSGLAFVPFGLGTALSSLTFRWLPNRLARAAPVLGALLFTGHFAALALLLPGTTEYPDVAAGTVLLVGGAALGWAFSPVLALILGRVPAEMASAASGLFSTTVQLAYLTGFAALGTVWFALAGSGSDAATATRAFTTCLWVCTGLTLLSLEALRRLRRQADGTPGRGKGPGGARHSDKSPRALRLRPTSTRASWTAQ